MRNKTTTARKNYNNNSLTTMQPAAAYRSMVTYVSKCNNIHQAREGGKGGADEDEEKSAKPIKNNKPAINQHLENEDQEDVNVNAQKEKKTKQKSKQRRQKLNTKNYSTTFIVVIRDEGEAEERPTIKN